jgi:hypothetical protein
MWRVLSIASSIILGVAFVLGWLFFSHTGEVAAASVESHSHAANPGQGQGTEEVISAALAYLRSRQQLDGGVAGFGESSDPDSTIRAVLAMAAAGRSPSGMQSKDGQSPLDYLAGQAAVYIRDATGVLFPGRAGMLLTAVAASDQDVTSFGGIDLVGEIEATYQPTTGAYSTTATQDWASGAASDLNQAWAILGMSAAGRPVPMTATAYLTGSQAEDGSWGFSDLDTTALAVTALIGSGNVAPHDSPILRALDFFRANQLPNGGWRPVWDTDPLNADTTGWVIQALAVTGYLPAAESWRAADGMPLKALSSLQKPDGSIGGTYVNAYSTAEAVFGLSGQPLYALGLTGRVQRALTWMAELQNPDGSWPALFGHPAGATVDVLLAFLAAGFRHDELRVSADSPGALDYLATTVAEYAVQGPDATGKLVLAVQAAGQDVRDFGGFDLVDLLLNTHYNPSIGGFGVITNTWHQAFGILGLATVGEAIPDEAVQALLALQQADGGWKYDLSSWNLTSAADSTGLALQALRAAGLPPEHFRLQKAIDYLRTTQDAQAGWGDANSTAYAIQGLLAASQNLMAGDWIKNSRSPIDALAAYQKVDGPFVYDLDSPWGPPADDFYATRQAIPALLGISFPFKPLSADPFVPSARGSDPDRTVSQSPGIWWGQGIQLQVPFGLDLDQDGTLAVYWRTQEEPRWFTASLALRMSGVYSLTIPLTPTHTYLVHVIVSDPDQVQVGSKLVAQHVYKLRLEAPFARRMYIYK